jgi:hypothetical protein
VKNSRTRVALLTKIILCCCTLIALTYSIFFAASPQAFAATKPHGLPKVTNPYSTTSGVIYPAWNFLGCGTGWNNAYDPIYLKPFKYAYTTGSQACSQAVWDDHQYTQNTQCVAAVFIPSLLATAKISYGFYRANGSLIERDVIDQNTASDFTVIPTNHAISGIHHVLISSNNGQTGTYMAAGALDFYCA